MTTFEQDLLKKAYAAFNTRDIDGALSTMQPNVEWPNGMEERFTVMRAFALIGRCSGA